MHKNATMKSSPFRPAALVFLLAACQLLEPPVHLGTPRSDEGLHTVIPGTPFPDTVLLVSALCYPQTYDWRKDSLFGRVPCTLKLFRDGEEALSLQAGPGTVISSSHDAHHIIDGSLFTEYTDSRQTVICRDGEKVASWAGRERIVGLLPKDGVLYTLGCSDAGMVFRKNGVEALRVEDGVPFGGFRFITYGRTGALYEHEEAVCFAFQSSRKGVPAVFIAHGGDPVEVLSVPGAKMLDAKLLRDGAAVLYDDSGAARLWHGRGQVIDIPQRGAITWEAAEIAELGGSLCAVGYCHGSGDSSLSFGIGRSNYSNRFNVTPLAAYVRTGELVPVFAGEDVPADCCFLSGDCACFSPTGGLTLALSPKDMSASPYVLCDGQKAEYPVHGILTGVSYYISD